jgi:hypothetical protein
MASCRLALSALLLVSLLGTVSCSKKTTEPSVKADVVNPPAVDVKTGPDLFQDVTASSGVSFRYRNGEEVQPPHLSILESLGGGLAVIDYDGDGLLDLFLLGGGVFGGKDNKDILGQPCKLYRNLGGFKFQDVTEAAGLSTLADGKPWFYSHGAAVADYDRDGWSDLLVTGWGRIALFHNESDGKGGRKFVDVSAKAGLDKGVTWATSAGWADFDGDGHADLYACQYVNWSFANNPDCNYDGKTPDVCPPKKFQGLPHLVFRNTGNGTFENVSDKVGLAKGGDGVSKGLGVVIADVNGDGKPDVYVANDTVPNFLYVNVSKPGTIAFQERGMLAGVAVDGFSNPNGSMGTDMGDPEGTGKPMILCTNYENELHALYRNASTKERTFFLYITPASGMGVLGQKFVGWGTGFVDLDRDGWEDIVIANGHAIRYPTGATRRQKPVIMMNTGGGKFAVSSNRGGDYFQSEHLSRGIVLADFDNDGNIDVAIANMNEPTAILKNISPVGNHWIGLSLVGAKHADVVGAKVRVTAGGRMQSRFAKGGGSYASSPDRRFVVGLGNVAGPVKVSVEWPDGTVQDFENVATDRYWVATQGKKELDPAVKK